MKALIFDSGALINLSMNGLIYILEGLKKNFDGKFLITQEVKGETIDRPMGIQRFELGALQIKNLIDTKILEMPSSLGIDENLLKNETMRLVNNANRTMQVKGQWVHLVEEAEMSCVALSAELNRRGFDTLIAIDERTTRMLCENPYNLEKIMSGKLHQNVKLVSSDANIFGKCNFIRSSELVYTAYKKGLIKLTGKRVLEALLYATKYKGASISLEEIDTLKKT
ncbi:MAG: hypothetical protein AABX85_00575 [Nanoarchaeota archaeon]